MEPGRCTEFWRNGMSGQDLAECKRLCENGKFYLPQPAQTDLFKTIFHEKARRLRPDAEFYDATRESTQKVINKLQEFWLEVFAQLSTIDCENEYDKRMHNARKAAKSHSEIPCPRKDANEPWAAHLDQFPPMEGFCNDVATAIEFLEKHVEVSDAPLEVYKKEALLLVEAQIQQQTWRERWERVQPNKKSAIYYLMTIRHYYCALIDVLFGVWPAPGRCLFHQGHSARLRTYDRLRNTNPNCIYNELYFWQGTDAFNRSRAPVPLDILDASYVETNGPFRFEKTDRLQEHLTVTKDLKIRVFCDWNRFLMLHVHEVLRNMNPPPRTLEDTKKGPPPKEQPSDRIKFVELSLGHYNKEYGFEPYRIRYFAQELLLTYLVLFYSHLRPADFRKPDAVMVPAQGLDGPEHGNSWKTWARKRRNIHDHIESANLESTGATDQEIQVQYQIDKPRPSVKVAKRLELDVGDLDELADFSDGWGYDISAPTYSDQFTRLFRGRLEDLHETLLTWKPYHFWEMKYKGYGDVRGIEWYGFYASLIFGLISILVLYFAILQFSQKWFPS